eukprot:6738134-Alexandrium_andersonii.AAC.1
MCIRDRQKKQACAPPKKILKKKSGGATDKRVSWGEAAMPAGSAGVVMAFKARALEVEVPAWGVARK